MTDNHSKRHAPASWRHALAGLLLLAPVVASSAPVLLHQPVPGAGTFSMNSPEARQTLLEVLNPVTITGVGAEIDPSSSGNLFEWRLYSASSTSGSGDSLGGALFASTGVSFTDVGLQVYDHAVSWSVAPGFYVLELFSLANNGSVPMRTYSESGQGLPFTTTDGNFNVLDGFANGSMQGSLQGNSILPAFSVAVGSAQPAPEPASLLLLGAGLLGFGSLRRARAG